MPSLSKNLDIKSKEAALTGFPLMDHDTFQSMFALLKAGSPRDPAPPKILNQVIQVVSPVICELIKSSILTGVPPLPLEKSQGQSSFEKNDP